jgi:hypothetical protein
MPLFSIQDDKEKKLANETILPMKRESQNRKVLKHLIKYRKIDGVTAWNKYGIMAVMRRIYDLRRMGYYNIATEIVKSKSGSRYAVYVFKPF